MRAEDIFWLRSASDAQPSPDGERIAYVVTELDRMHDQVRTSIWLVPASGGTPRRLTNVNHNSSQPRWSPDGKTLAFVSNRDSGAQIWLLPLDGGEAESITDVAGGITGPPVWSPDGRQIVFTAQVSSQNPSAAGAPRVIRHLRYMLNGAGYIGDRFWHVFTVAVDGMCAAPAVRLTSGEWHHFSPGWSPDSTRITCITTRRDDWDTEWVWDVYVFDAQDRTAVPRLLTRSGGTCAAPVWSPDGRWIAYFDNQCPGTAYTKDYDLWIAPAAGGAARNVTGPLDRGCQVSQPPSSNEPPRWSTDSSIIYFHVRDGGFYHYYAYHLADDRLHPVLASRGAEQPTAGFVRGSTDHRLLAVAAATTLRPRKVHVVARDGSRRQLTDINGDALASLQLRAPRRLADPSPEGWEVESWLWLPPVLYAW